MSEHLTETQAQAFRENTTPSEELPDVAAHLAACEACSLRVLDREARAAAVSKWREHLHSVAHLAYEQQEAYVDRTLAGAERRLVDAHLEICSRCREDITGLEAFRQELQSVSVAPLENNTAPSSRGGAASRSLRGIAYSLSGVALAAALLWFVWMPAFSRPRSRVASIPSSADVAKQAQIARLENALQTADTESQRLQTQQKEIASARDAAQARNTVLAVRLAKIEKDLRDAKKNQKGKNDGMQMLALARQQGRFDFPDMRSLIAPGPIARGDEKEAFGPAQPEGVVTLSDQPVLRWFPYKKARHPIYQVTVRDVAGHIAAQTPRPVTEGEWRVAPPLRRGELYTWNVAAGLPGQPLYESETRPTGKFRVASPAERNTIFNLQFSAAARCAKIGALDETEAILNAIKQAEPEGAASRDADRLLESVRAKRRQNQSAANPANKPFP